MAHNSLAPPNHFDDLIEQLQMKHIPSVTKLALVVSVGRDLVFTNAMYQKVLSYFPKEQYMVILQSINLKLTASDLCEYLSDHEDDVVRRRYFVLHIKYLESVRSVQEKAMILSMFTSQDKNQMLYIAGELAKVPIVEGEQARGVLPSAPSLVHPSSVQPSSVQPSSVQPPLVPPLPPPYALT